MTMTHYPDSEIVMADLCFGDDFFEQDRSWDDFGTTISGIYGTHQNVRGSRMPVSLMVPRVDDKLGSFRWQIIEKLLKVMFFLKWHFKTNKKALGRDAGHRISEWGYTKTQLSNENQYTIVKIRKSDVVSEIAHARNTAVAVRMGETCKWGQQIQGCVISDNRRPLPGMPRLCPIGFYSPTTK